MNFLSTKKYLNISIFITHFFELLTINRIQESPKFNLLVISLIHFDLVYQTSNNNSNLNLSMIGVQKNKGETINFFNKYMQEHQ